MGSQHAEQALALAQLTKPGPFGNRTIELGAYFGVFDGPRLIVMAGERMRAGPFREVSGVCTHPYFQGRGLARQLMVHLVQRQLRRGAIPFLHATRLNEVASAFYQGLGFRIFKEPVVRVLALSLKIPQRPETMGQRYTEIPAPMIEFIGLQKIFFVGTAGDSDTRVNVSPKGMDSFRVLGPDRVIWLNTTGSGNETAAHLLENRRMTIMFCALEGKPVILRLYGKAIAVHPRDDAWTELYARFNPIAGARQIFDLHVELVQTSCGMAVPFFNYTGERTQLNEWAKTKGPDGIHDYWTLKNQVSLDGKPTQILG